MEKRKKMVDRLEERKKSPMAPEKDEYMPRFDRRRKASLESGQISSDRKRVGKDRNRPKKSTENYQRKSYNPKKEEVGNSGQRSFGVKRILDDDMSVDNNAGEIDWKKLKLENEKMREVDRASQMEARNRLAALAGGYVTATGEAVDSPPEPDEASTSSGFGGRPLNPERPSRTSGMKFSGRNAREETEIVELDSDDDDGDFHGESQRNMSREDLLAVHGIRVVDDGQRKVQPLNLDSPETIVLSDEQEDEWEETQQEEKQSENVGILETKDEDGNDLNLSLSAPDIEEELNNS